jgi:hypothetical protein
MSSEATNIQISPTLKATIRQRTHDYRDRASAYGRATRVYVSTPDAYILDRGGEVVAQPAYTLRGEDAESDRAWDAYNRAEVRAMRAALDEARKTIEQATQSAGWRARFSRTAGCSCPCSPGLVLSETLRVDRRPVDIWLSRTCPAEHSYRMLPDGKTFICNGCDRTAKLSELTDAEVEALADVLSAWLSA